MAAAGTTLGSHAGETGIGKSLAYLLPLAVHLSLTGQRALISTYTVHLIHQLNDDKEKIRRILNHLQLRPVAIANRLGRAQYISASRLALAETTEDAASKQQLLAWHCIRKSASSMAPIFM